MPKRYPRMLIEDILERIGLVEEYTRGLSDGQILLNQLVCDGILRSFEIIGEASRQLPENIRKQFSHIPWDEVIGLRNRVVHEYADIDMSIVLTIARRDLPVLKNQLTNDLNKFPEKA